MPTSKLVKLRWGLAVLSLVLLIVTTALTLRSVKNTSLTTGLADIKYNELISESLKNRVDFSRSLFQIALLITGALWGLVIAKKDEAGIVFSDRPEWAMFITASLLLLASLVDHALYLQYVSRILELGGSLFDKNEPSMPDVFDPNINNFYEYQIAHLGLGFLVAVLTLFSAHKLKESYEHTNCDFGDGDLDSHSKHSTSRGDENETLSQS